MEKNKDTKKVTKTKNHKIADHIFAFIINLGLLYVVNNLLNWGVPALTLEFNKVIWFFQISLVATSVANLILIFIHSDLFEPILNAITNGTSFFAIYMFMLVFPLRFQNPSNVKIAMIVVIVALIGTGIGIIVELVKLGIKIFRLVKDNLIGRELGR